ncbi:hypothetical protein OQ968_21600 [Mycobacterium sp. 663a-19]|nr:hypothetical protein [Mycobacterium sp. 663a-19]MEB3983850.1 hypothetical protein [Mycobacterium sp. 663a-19]
MRRRRCDADWRVRLRGRPDGADIARRAGDYAAGYADRQAERARG